MKNAIDNDFGYRIYLQESWRPEKCRVDDTKNCRIDDTENCSRIADILTSDYEDET